MLKLGGISSTATAVAFSALSISFSVTSGLVLLLADRRARRILTTCTERKMRFAREKKL